MSKQFYRHFTEELSSAAASRAAAASADAIQVIELHLPASLDASEFDALNESILQILDGQTGRRWVIDLAHVEYIGSSVLGLIVNLRQRIKAGNGRLALCSLSPRLIQIFRHSSLERLFTISRTRPEAVVIVSR